MFGMGVQPTPVGRRVVVAGHEVVRDGDLVHEGADVVLPGQPEAGQVAGVDDGGHVEALGEAAGQLDAERVEVDVADVEDAGVTVDRGSEGVGGGSHQLVELTGEVGQPIADAAERPDLALHRLERRRSPLEGAFESGRLEGGRAELLPGPALQEADRHHAADGTEQEVAPPTARQERPDHGPGQRGDHQGLDDQLDDERRDVDAGVVFEAPHRIGEPGDRAGPVEIDLGDAGLDLERRVMRVDDHAPEGRDVDHRVAAPRPARGEPHVARPDPTLGGDERERGDGRQPAEDQCTGREQQREATPPLGPALLAPTLAHPLVDVRRDVDRAQARHATSRPPRDHRGSACASCCAAVTTCCRLRDGPVAVARRRAQPSRQTAPMDSPLAAAVEAALGAKVVASGRVHGGDVAVAYQVDLADGRRVFVKTHRSPPPGFFTTEAASLTWLAEADAVSAPGRPRGRGRTHAVPGPRLDRHRADPSRDGRRPRARAGRAPPGRRTLLRAHGPPLDR